MMAEFLAMGGYGVFIWPCYALFLGGMVWIALSSWRRATRAAYRLQETEENRAADRSR